MTDGHKRASGLEAADVGLGLRPKNIGARVKRVEDPRLLTGQGMFTADRLVPGALHVAFRRSDHAHALISSISTSAAAEMPGVFTIYTARELNDLVEPVRASRAGAAAISAPTSPRANSRIASTLVLASSCSSGASSLTAISGSSGSCCSRRGVVI